MTPETKRKVKQETFCEMRRDALTCIKAVVDMNVEDTWEGVMSALAKVRRGSDEEFAAVCMACMKWMHAYCEQLTYKKVADAEALIAHDAEAAHASGNAAKAAPAAAK